MELTARKIVPLFEKGQTVVLDPGVDPNDHPELAADGIQHDVDYEVLLKTVHCGEYSIRLKCPDGRYTEALPPECFIPKKKEGA